MVMTIRCSSL